MLVVSDTNIPSSLAACEALSLLFRLLEVPIIYIPPSYPESKIYLGRLILSPRFILDILSSVQDLR